MAKTSQWVYELQQKCGFTEDKDGNPIINWHQGGKNECVSKTTSGANKAISNRDEEKRAQ